MKSVGRKIIRLESVDSTNNYTANLIKDKNVTHGSVILAVEQTAGRGQRGAEWLVKPGENLTFSLFIDEVKLSVTEQFKITQLVSLVLCEVLRSFSIPASIKWPNDIYVGSEKIAGILIENQIQGSKVRSSIIGIGLNINQMNFEGMNATSMKKMSGEFVRIEEVLFKFIDAFNEISPKLNQLQEEYLNHLYLLNKHSTFAYPNGDKFTGTIKGVSDIGKLQVLIENEIQEFDLKGIAFIPQSEI